MNQNKHFSVFRFRAFLIIRNVVLTFCLFLFSNNQLFAATDVTAGTSNYNVSATSAGGTAFTSANNLILTGWGNPVYTLTANVQCVDLTLNQSVRLSMNGFTLTVTGNLVIADNNGMQIDLGSGGQLLVTGNATIGSSCGITGSGACLFQVGGASLMANYNNTFITLGASGTLKVAGNMTVGSTNTVTIGTLEMSGCGQNMDVSSAFSVTTFRQSSSCGTTITRSGGTSTITVTTYDQNYNGTNIKPGSNFNISGSTINTSSTKTWNGGGGDDNWMTAGNWVGGVAPTGGEDLVFAGSTRTTPNNNFTAGTSFNSITFSSGASNFTLSGNALTITGGSTAITASNTSGTMTISNNITFGTVAPTITTATGGALTLSGTIANGGYLLTITGTGTTSLSGVISGTGGLTINTALNNVTVASGVNTFSGVVTITMGGLRITNSSGLGSGTKETTMTNGTLGQPSLRLDGSGGNITLASTLSFLTSTSGGTNGGIINEAGNNTIAGNFTLTSGGGGTRFMVNGGTLTVSGTITPNQSSRAIYLQGTGNGTISGVYADGGHSPLLLKSGSGTWTLSNANTYTGATTISAGTLVLQNQYDTPSFDISSGAILELNRTSGLVYTANTSFTGAGTLKKTGGGAISWGSASATFGFSSGALIDVEGGIFTGGSFGNEVWTSNLSDLTVASGAEFDGVEANVIVNALNGAGSVKSGWSGSGSITFGADNGTGTFLGIISDYNSGSNHTGAIIKTGSGTQTLSGANSYSRTTTISAGTLQLGAAGVIPDGSAVTVNGTLDLNSYSETIGSLAGSGTVDEISAAATPTLTCGGDNSNTTFSGTIQNTTGTLSVVKTGSGTLTLSGANTNAKFYGNAGILSITNTNALQHQTFVNGGTLQVLHNGSGNNGTITIPSDLVINSGNTGTINVANNGSNTGNTVSFRSMNQGNATLNITGSNSYSVTIPSFIQSGGGTGTAILNPTTANLLIGTITTSLIAHTVQLDGTSTGNIISGIISDAGGYVMTVTKSNNSIWTLSGANTFTGLTTISGGTLKLGNTSALPGGDIAFSGTGILDMNGYNNSISDISSSVNTATITDNSLVAGTTTLNITDFSHKISCLINNGGTRTLALRVANNNSGTEMFLASNSNTFSGGLILAHHASSGSRLSIYSTITGTPFGSGSITIGESATDRAGIYITSNANTITNNIIYNTALGNDRKGIRVDVAGVVLSGTITANLSNAIFSTNGTGTVSLTGKITGTNGFELDNSWGTSLTVTLNNSGTANDYAGSTIVDDATTGSLTTCALVLGAANQIPNGSGKGNVTLNGTLNLGGFSETINGLSGSGFLDGVSGTPTITIGDNNATSTFSGVIKNTSGTLAVTKTGSGTLTLSGVNTFSGTTTISTGGTLKLGNTSALPGGALALSGTGILDLNGYNSSVSDITSSVNTSTITDNSGVAGTTTLNISAMATTISSLILDGSTRALAIRIKNQNASFQLFPGTNANTFSGGLTLANSNVGGSGTRMRVTSAITTVGSAGAITSCPYGRGTIYVGESTSDYAQILFDTYANNSLANAIVFNTALGIDFAGGLRIDNGGHTFSGTISANLADIKILGNGGGSASATFTGQITGTNGFILSEINGGTLAITLTNAGTANNYSGSTTIGTSCTLKLGASNQIPDASAVTVTGIFDLNSYSETIGSITGVGIIDDVAGAGTSTLTCGGDNSTLTFSGTIQNTSGSVVITKAGSGTWTLSGTNTYTGLTTVSAGILKLGAGSNVTTSGPLGTNAGGISVSSGAALDLNGQTIGTTNAEAITLYGTGITSGGALMNSSSSAATYGGLITLGSPSSIIAGSGDINIFAVGTITGPTFGLTLGGAHDGQLLSILGTTTGTLTKQDAGTWTIRGANTYTGLTTVSGGVFKIGSTTALGSIAAGTVVNSGAAIDFNGVGYVNSEALTINGTGISNSGVIYNSNATPASFPGDVYLASASTIKADNQITLSGTFSNNQHFTKTGIGSLIFGSGTVTVNDFAISAGTLAAGSSTINIYGNFTPTGTFTANTSTVNMLGSGSQSIPAVTYNNLTINNSSGATLAGTIPVNGTLTMTAGILNTGSYTVDLGSTGSLSEVNPSATAPTSYITGNVKATRSLMQNVQNTFGGIGVDITDANLTNNSTVVIRSTGTSCTALGHTGIKRYYTITPATDAGLNASFVFHYFDNEIVGTEANLKLYKSYNSRVKWYIQSSSTVNTANNTITQSGISDFSDWTASDAIAQGLPIELSSFTTNKKGNGVLLEWLTASEINNQSFIIERSSDGINWTTVYTCDGAGTSTEVHRYSFVDNNPINGVNYYRLKQTDVDGTTTYSKIISEKIQTLKISVQVYPNPAKADEITVEISNTISENIKIRISDMYGRQLTEGEIEMTGSSLQLKVSDYCSLSTGTYILSVVGKKDVIQNKFIVE